MVKKRRKLKEKVDVPFFHPVSMDGHQQFKISRGHYNTHFTPSTEHQIVCDWLYMHIRNFKPEGSFPLISLLFVSSPFSLYDSDPVYIIYGQQKKVTRRENALQTLKGQYETCVGGDQQTHTDKSKFGASYPLTTFLCVVE